MLCSSRVLFCLFSPQSRIFFPAVNNAFRALMGVWRPSRINPPIMSIEKKPGFLHLNNLTKFINRNNRIQSYSLQLLRFDYQTQLNENSSYLQIFLIKTKPGFLSIDIDLPTTHNNKTRHQTLNTTQHSNNYSECVQDGH